METFQTIWQYGKDSKECIARAKVFFGCDNVTQIDWDIKTGVSTFVADKESL